jgi:hypothetical protein
MRYLSLLLIALATTAQGQEIVTDLNGFRLGQFRDVPKNELKTILQQDKFEDGFEYEIYLVEKDTSVYMIFEYANYDLQTIWSIQLTGNKKGFDCSFKGLKLGMSETELISNVGRPSSVEDAGEYGKKWVYENKNYTLEISPDGTLGGIKIIDMSRDFYPEPDLNKLPKFSEYTEILESNNATTISNLLSSGMEIYKNDSVYFFNKSISNEIENDDSGIFKLISEFAAISRATDETDTLQYEENMRVTEYQGVLHVAKFRINEKYSEIVFKYMFGEYLIWEMKIN